MSDCSTEMASPDRSRSPQGLDSDEEKANKTITNNNSDAEVSQEGHDSQDESKTSTPVVDGLQKSDDQISLHAKGDFDSPVKEVTAKSIRATRQKIPAKGKGKISVQLHSKMEEEKALKKECDSLEHEVLQTEKLQDSIDKYKQKIKELKKRKEGEQIRKGVKSIIKENEGLNKIKDSGMLSKQEIKAVCLPIFDRLNLKKSDQSEFISELLKRTSRRRKVRRQQHKSFKKTRGHSPSSSTDSSTSSYESSSEDGNRKSGSVRHRSRSLRSRSRSMSLSRRKGKLKSGITEKPKEADLVMKVKWATALLGTKSEIAFDDMSFDQYILGETQILNRPKISEAEKSTRIHLMKRISKLNEKLGFNKSKELYREVLNAIEKGEFTWCNYYEIERLENEIRFDNMSVVERSIDESKKRRSLM